MPTRMTCPHCGIALNLPDQMVAKTMRCGNCRQLIAAAAPRPVQVEPKAINAKLGTALPAKAKPAAPRRQPVAEPTQRRAEAAPPLSAPQSAPASTSPMVLVGAL